MANKKKHLPIEQYKMHKKFNEKTFWMVKINESFLPRKSSDSFPATHDYDTC